MTVDFLSLGELEIGVEWGRSSKNRKWSRAIDGRVTSCHFLWIEPRIRPDREDPVHGQVTQVASDCGTIVVAGEGVVDAAVSELARQVVRAVVESEMMTFPLLASEDVPVSVCKEQVTRYGPTPTSLSAIDAGAEAVLAWACANVVTQWVKAAREWSDRAAIAQPVRDLGATSDLLTASLLWHYHDRALEYSDANYERQWKLERWLLNHPPTEVFTTSPNESVVAELVSYHYPFWDRAYFCFFSPWDDFKSPTAPGIVKEL